MPVEIVSVVDEGLGHSGHVVAVDGQALVVDPLRAVDRYVRVIEARGWTLRWVADTHTHADYVSGGLALAARGAAFYASRGADLLTEHRPLDGGDQLDVDGLTLRALPTPGHTPDHLAFLLLDAGTPVAVLSGGSLMVGAVGRTDLLGAERAEELARAMFRSLHEQLLVLPDEVPVYPTHGAGSFCSAPAGSERASTIGWERAHNPLLQIIDEDTFAARLVGGVGPLPAHFRWLPEVNRRGVPSPPRAPLPSLVPAHVQDLMAAGAQVIDVRPVTSFAAGQVPGSLSIALRPAFGSWLGWLVPPDRPLVFVTAIGTKSTSSQWPTSIRRAPRPRTRRALRDRRSRSRCPCSDHPSVHRPQSSRRSWGWWRRRRRSIRTSGRCRLARRWR